jgi:hypothetical protein
MKETSYALLIALMLVTSATADAKDTVPEPRPAPQMQVIPLPYHQALFQRDGVELTRYHFGPSLHRPFVFPVIGPSGRSLTRMGHPHDPESHSHHNSVWISHHDVGGVDFWGDRGKGKIRHKRIVDFQDSDKHASMTTGNQWVTDKGKVLLLESRTITVLPLANSEWLLMLDLQFKADGEPVTLGKTPFGMIGVRMAKSIGVNDGGGMIRNSEGAVNEKEVFWKQARWVDYSGPIVGTEVEGVTLFDHPGNPNFPSHFHVRNDGWMGASLTFDGPRTIQPGALLNLHYGLYIHGRRKSPEAIEVRWKHFAETQHPASGNSPQRE